MRITAQLIEAETRAHLWADRFDGALEDVFDLQDRITDSVVGIVEPSLRAVADRALPPKRPENLDAYDLDLAPCLNVTLMTAEGAGIGARLLDDALTLDPNYAAAHAHLAWCHETLFVHAGHDEVHRTAGVRHARIAIASGTDDAAALALAARYDRLSRQGPRRGDRRYWARSVAQRLVRHCAPLGRVRPRFQRQFRRRNCPRRPRAAVEPVRSIGLCSISGNGLIGGRSKARYEEAALQFAKGSHANPGHTSQYFFRGDRARAGGTHRRSKANCTTWSRTRTELAFSFFLRNRSCAVNRGQACRGRAPARVARESAESEAAPSGLLYWRDPKCRGTFTCCNLSAVRLLANGVPHFVQGISGHRFQSPFRVAARSWKIVSGRSMSCGDLVSCGRLRHPVVLRAQGFRCGFGMGCGWPRRAGGGHHAARHFGRVRPEGP